MLSVTRSTAKLLQSIPVKRCFVALERNLQAEALSWLTQTVQTVQTVPRTQPQKPKKIAQRRGSVAGGMVFSVNNKIVETSVDFLGKIPHSKRFQNAKVSNMIKSIKSNESGSFVHPPIRSNKRVQATTSKAPIKKRKPNEVAASNGKEIGSLCQHVDHIGQSNNNLTRIECVACTKQKNDANHSNSKDFDPFRRSANISLALPRRLRLDSII